MSSTPTTLKECNDRGLCTFYATGESFHKQIWFSVKNGDNNIGMCENCANTDFADLKEEGKLVQRESPFYCDHAVIPGGILGRKPTLYTKPFADPTNTQSTRDFPITPDITLQEISIWDTNHTKSIGDLIPYNSTSKIVSSTLPPEDTSDSSDSSDSSDPSNLFGSSDTSDRAFHNSFNKYLLICWSIHAGMVIDPAILWSIVASQFAQWLLAHPESFRELFTTDPTARKELVFNVTNPDDLQISTIINGLKKVIPGNSSHTAEQIIDALNPVVSTSTPMSGEAIAASFCEAMEAYYAYSTSMCGVRNVRVLGTTADWLKLAKHSNDIVNILNSLSTKDNAVEQMIIYFQLIEKRFADIARMDRTTWINFFKIVNCSSGHDNIVQGWITELYSLNTPPKQIYIDFSGNRSIIARSLNDYKEGSQVHFRNIDTMTDYRRCYGVFASKLDADGFLVPEIHHVLICDGPVEDEQPEAFGDTIVI